MLLLILIAGVGWLLFFAMVGIYLVGNRIYVRETNSLALFSLAILFSDDFRRKSRTEIDRVVGEQKSSGNSNSVNEFVCELMVLITDVAQSLSEPDAEPNSISIVASAVGPSRR
jgi:hypothetical protein